MSDPVFDTDIIGDWLRGVPQAAAELARYRKHRTSRLSWMELLAAEPLESRDALEALLTPFQVIELDARIGAAAADIVRRSGLGLTRAIILATAQCSGAILITRNTEDFPAAMPGIRVPYTL
ncbi:type II toxin-antitoxin system VapC family toxin [Erythrobacter litoralis]|uniref:PIN domain-containing protein n=1 Tax=Erythrobacter litoralis (strain HTCC2594) TaxID=314225 RepID=Q2NCL4_ERYLH|nr:type II toxin-antitoxin system VapC family toxin [Erythrobacter litoralis]ABC62577.1 hypothetical protein ELI_02425 [Erythrobacter litoralis HTCC2594]